MEELIRKSDARHAILHECPAAAHCIDSIKPVDAVEVVHGKWERVIPTKSAAKWSIKMSCSVCHRQGYTHHKYCPNCGAKMDLEDYNELS